MEATATTPQPHTGKRTRADVLGVDEDVASAATVGSKDAAAAAAAGDTTCRAKQLKDDASRTRAALCKLSAQLHGRVQQVAVNVAVAHAQVQTAVEKGHDPDAAAELHAGIDVAASQKTQALEAELVAVDACIESCDGILGGAHGGRGSGRGFYRVFFERARRLLARGCVEPAFLRVYRDPATTIEGGGALLLCAPPGVCAQDLIVTIDDFDVDVTLAPQAAARCASTYDAWAVMAGVAPLLDAHVVYVTQAGTVDTHIRPVTHKELAFLADAESTAAANSDAAPWPVQWPAARCTGASRSVDFVLRMSLVPRPGSRSQTHTATLHAVTLAGTLLSMPRASPYPVVLQSAHAVLAAVGGRLELLPTEARTYARCLHALCTTPSKWLVSHVIPPHVQTPEFFLAAVQQDKEVLRVLEVEHLTPALCLAAVEADVEAFRMLDAAYCTPAVNDAAVRADSRLFSFVPAQDQTAGLCKLAVQKDCTNFRFVRPDLRTPELAFAAVQANPKALGWLLTFYHAVVTPTVAATAVADNARVLWDVDHDHWSAAHWTACVQSNGMTLSYVPEQERTLELCVEAVKQNLNALAFVPQALKARVLQHAMSTLPASASTRRAFRALRALN